MRRLGTWCGVLLLGGVVTGMTLWGMGALYYSPLPTLLRQLLAITFGLVTGRGVSGSIAPPPHTPGLRARVGRPGVVVEYYSPLKQPGLAARCGRLALCDHRRRPCNPAQYSQFRVSHGNGFHPTVLRQDVRPAAIGVGRHDQLLLGGRGHCTPVCELWLRWAGLC